MSIDGKFPPAKLARIVERVRNRLYRLNQRLVPAPFAMLELILGAWVSQAIQAVAELGVADALAKGPLPLSDLAGRVGADPDTLGRLMRALIGRGIFRQHRDGRYDLTPLADTLRSDAPASMAGAALLFGSKQHREHWGQLAESIRSGEPGVGLLRGKSLWDYLGEDREYAALFNNAMTSISAMAVPTIVGGYDFSHYPTIVDVGGGHGGLLAAILAATPSAQGVLYDLPNVVAEASALLGTQGVADRVRVEGGSFFDSVPQGGDAYLLKHIIHDWPDEQAVAILRNVRAAAGDQATILLVECVIPEDDRDFPGKWTDLEMVVQLPGRERTEAEYRDLLRQAGYLITRVVQTASPFSVVEAAPA